MTQTCSDALTEGCKSASDATWPAPAIWGSVHVYFERDLQRIWVWMERWIQLLATKGFLRQQAFPNKIFRLPSCLDVSYFEVVRLATVCVSQKSHSAQRSAVQRFWSRPSEKVGVISWQIAVCVILIYFHLTVSFPTVLRWQQTASFPKHSKPIDVMIFCYHCLICVKMQPLLLIWDILVLSKVVRKQNQKKKNLAHFRNKSHPPPHARPFNDVESRKDGSHPIHF